MLAAETEKKTYHDVVRGLKGHSPGQYFLCLFKGLACPSLLILRPKLEAGFNLDVLLVIDGQRCYITVVDDLTVQRSTGALPVGHTFLLFFFFFFENIFQVGQTGTKPPRHSSFTLGLIL